MFKTISHILAPTFTRPADTTAYADGDLVANSATAGSVVPLVFSVPVGNGRSIEIIGGTLQKSDQTDVANSQFRIHVYTSSPTPANGDNAAWSTDIAGYLGFVDLGLMIAHTDDAYIRTYIPLVEIMSFNIGPKNVLYGLIEADAAYIPASEETFTAGLILAHYGR